MHLLWVDLYPMWQPEGPNSEWACAWRRRRRCVLYLVCVRVCPPGPGMAVAAPVTVEAQPWSSAGVTCRVSLPPRSNFTLEATAGIESASTLCACEYNFLTFPRIPTFASCSYALRKNKQTNKRKIINVFCAVSELQQTSRLFFQRSAQIEFPLLKCAAWRRPLTL